MQTKNVVIIGCMIIGLASIGGVLLATNPLQTNNDAYGVDSQTVMTLVENKERVLIIDVRPNEKYLESHIAGASNDLLVGTTMEKRVNTIHNMLPDVVSNYNFILIDEDGFETKQLAKDMNDLGLQTFYLTGGMKQVSENLISDDQTVIDSKELMEKIISNEDLYLLDVREPDELLESKIDGAINIPLAEIFTSGGTDDIPTDKPVVIICGSGNRATIATYALVQDGVDFMVLEGGMKAWNAEFND